MSLPLKDFRLGITDSIYAALEADSIAFDKDMQLVAREILQNWADRKHVAYTVYAKRCGCRAHFPLNQFEWTRDMEPMDPDLQAAWSEAEAARRAARQKEGDALLEATERAELARLTAKYGPIPIPPF